MKKKESCKPMRRDFGFGFFWVLCVFERYRLFLVIRSLSFISADNIQTKCKAKKQRVQQQNPSP